MLLEHKFTNTMDVRHVLVPTDFSAPADAALSHAVSLADRFVLGSNTERVVRTAPCPVLTVPPTLDEGDN
ncbi:MAG: universal stress protein [Salinibacter sp.]